MNFLVSTILSILIIVTCGSYVDSYDRGQVSAINGSNNLNTQRNSINAVSKDLPVPGCHPSRPNDEERETTANLHNHLRRKVARGKEERGNEGPQPSAKNMRVLNYDMRLEDLAFQWASHCDHNIPVDKAIDGYESIHRSMLYQPGLTDRFNIVDTIQENRYENVKNMHGLDAIGNFNGSNSRSGEDVRSYAIIVNAATYGIGCAHSYYLDESTGEKKRFYVCNYGNGLRKSSPIYQQGKPCEGLKDDCCDGGLVRAYCWSQLH